MIQATLRGQEILITSDAQAAPTAARIPGATRNARMPPLTWVMPFTLDGIQELRNVKAMASPGLIRAVKEAGEVARYVEQVKKSGELAPLMPVPVKQGITLYQHQIKAFNIALAQFGHMGSANGGSVAYFMDMGTGKTLTTIAVSGRLFLDGKIRRILIVAPSSVCAVWPAEFRKFAGFPVRVGVLLGERDKRIKALRHLMAPVPPGAPDPLRVAVINYESTWRLEEELAQFKPDMVVCDESQRIKNATAQQSKAMHRLGAGVPYKMILTGTPIQNDTRDFWSQYRFLAPGIFHPSYYAYLKRYAVMGGVGNHQYLGPRNLEDKAKKLYKRIQRESFAALEGGEQVTVNNVLTRLLRLQQITGGFLSDDDGKLQPISTAKLDALSDIVQSCCVDEGKKLVIFARFRAEIAAIQERVAAIFAKENKRQADTLAKKNLKQVAIWGDIPIHQRGAIVEQFQTDPDTRVFVGQIDACAEGITLNSATTTLYYSVNWNLAKYQQSQDRTHRIGVKDSCLYIHLVVPGTIDRQIMTALKKKEDLAKSVVDNWKALLSEDAVDG